VRVFLEGKINWTITIISTVIFILFLFIVLPWMSAYTARVIEVAEAPDTKLFYSAESFYEIVDAYGEEGRRIYIRLRWTFDLIWPLVYLTFFITLMIQLTRDYKTSWIGHLYWLVFVATGFDYLENTLASFLMSIYPRRIYGLATMSSVSSSLKWLSIFLVFFITVILLVQYLWKLVFRHR